MILGIDPGLENTGWAVVDEGRLVSCGVILTKKTQKMAERLEIIYNEVEEKIKRYKVTAVALESLFFAKNAKSALKVAEAIGIIRLCGRKNGLEVREYTPLQVKMALVGYGRADKNQVEIMVRNELNLDEVITPDHASDAVAVALTDGFTVRIQN